MSPFIWLAVAAVMAVVEVVSFGSSPCGSSSARSQRSLRTCSVPTCLSRSSCSWSFPSVPRGPAPRVREVPRPRKAGGAHPCRADAVVVEDVDNDGMTGRVETDNRMTWAARSADGLPIPAGEVVRIVSQESVKLIVERKR